MSVIVDNSVALAWLLPDEKSTIADSILDRTIAAGAFVPFIFAAEFGNGLTIAVRRGRISYAERAIAIDRIYNALNVALDVEGLNRMHDAIDLADRYDLSVYDALYLELAQRMSLPLATFDKKLISAARRAGVGLPAQEA